MHADTLTVAFRLQPDADLKQSLLDYCIEHKVDAACIESCVGSLKYAAIRFADNSDGTHVNGKLEIISLSGTLSRHGAHLHVAVSDDHGKVIGGHLMAGSLIYTTAEIVLRKIPDVIFKREFDATTGHRELAIRSVGAASYDDVGAQRKASTRGIIISVLFHVVLFWCLLYFKQLPKKIPPPVHSGGTLVYLPMLQKKLPPKEKSAPSKSAAAPKQNVPLRQPKELKQADNVPATPSDMPVVAPPPQEDMMSHLQARRQQRTEAAAKEQVENSPPQESDGERANRIARENVGLSQKRNGGSGPGDSGGLFTINHLGISRAEFYFRGWSADTRRENAQQLFKVEQGTEEDIKIAVIKKMIEIIRTKYQGDFVWESHRLGRSVTRSARMEDTAGLIQFLMLEIFPDNGRQFRR